MPRHFLILAVMGFAAVAGVALALSRNAPEEPAPVQAPPAPAKVDAEPAKPEKPEVAFEKPRSPLSIPKNGGVWPWPIDKAPREAPMMQTALTQVVRKKDGKERVSVKSAVVNPTVGRAVVTMSGFDPKNRPQNKSLWGEICLCDLTSGRVISQWETAKVLAPFDLHRDGRRFLMRFAHGGYDLAAQQVELWELNSQNEVRRRTWRPYSAGTGSNSNILSFDEAPQTHIPEAQVKWAGFVGNNHIATVHGATLKLWDAASLEQEIVIPGVVGLPSVSPDGGKLAFLTGDAVALLDPETRSIVSAKRLGTLPPNPVLSFHPSGARLAAIGTGKTIILELTNGQVWDAMLVELKNDTKGDWSEMPPAHGWAGDRHIFFNGELFDLDMPVPVWRYSWANWANIQGRSAWAVADHPSDDQVLLRSYTIPHPTMQSKLKTLLLTSDIFDLRPRDRVSVDVSGISTKYQANIRSALEKRLSELGFSVEPGASIVFKASVDPTPKPAKVTYDGKEYSYTAQAARLKIEKAGKEIWSTVGCNYPPMLIWYNTSTGLADTVKEYGGADYQIFTHKPLPGVIRKSGKTNGALGSSSFRAFGIEEK